MDMEKLYWDKEWLYKEHIEEGKSINKIADEQGVAWQTIRRHLRKNNIPIQKQYEWSEQHPNLKPSPVLAYVLGVLDGDGSVNNGICIELVTKELEFAQGFEKALRSIGLRAYVRNNDHWNKSLQRQYRGWKCYANSVVFVRWYRNLTQEQKEEIARQYPKEYLKGFFESEGTYIIRTDGSVNVHFSNFNRELLLMVQRLLTLLGYESRIYERKYKDHFSGREVTDYRLNLLGSSEEKHEFIRRLNPVIKNKPYDYSDPNGLRGRK